LTAARVWRQSLKTPHFPSLPRRLNDACHALSCRLAFGDAGHRGRLPAGEAIDARPNGGVARQPRRLRHARLPHRRLSPVQLVDAVPHGVCPRRLLHRRLRSELRSVHWRLWTGLCFRRLRPGGMSAGARLPIAGRLPRISGPKWLPGRTRIPGSTGPAASTRARPRFAFGPGVRESK
jgi:hypothetical protein